MNFLEIKADKTSIKIGEHITLHIKASADAELVLPFKVGEADKSGLTIVSSPKIQGDEIVFDITSYKAGEIQIPSMQIKVKNEVLYETISLNIKVEGKTSELQLIDIRPPRDVSPSIFYYLGIAALLIMLILVARALYKKFFTKTKIKQDLTPFERAMRDLNNIQTNQANYNGAKEIVFRVTEALKKFIEDEYYLEIMDLTTTEIITTLKSNERFNSAIVNDLSEYLKSSDFVKFANQNNSEAINNYIDKAKNFVGLLKLPEDNRYENKIEGNKS